MGSHPDSAIGGTESKPFLARLSAPAIQAITSVQRIHSYAPGVHLFNEGDPAAGLYILLEGQLKLSLGSPDGGCLNLRLFREGDVVGLTAVLQDPGKFTSSAEALFSSRVAFVSRSDFKVLLKKHTEIYPALLEEFSRRVASGCDQLRTVALCHSATSKLARLLLDWAEDPKASSDAARLRCSLTHEQIGAFIGASRETVSRTLGDFKRQKLLVVNGSRFTIPDRDALERYAM